jgi:hypothetical protein
MPTTVFVLMVLMATTKSYEWHPAAVGETLAQCRTAATPENLMTAHGPAERWKCVRFTSR